MEGVKKVFLPIIPKLFTRYMQRSPYGFNTIASV